MVKVLLENSKFQVLYRYRYWNLGTREPGNADRLYVQFFRHSFRFHSLFWASTRVLQGFAIKFAYTKVFYCFQYVKDLHRSWSWRGNSFAVFSFLCISIILTNIPHLLFQHKDEKSCWLIIGNEKTGKAIIFIAFEYSLCFLIDSCCCHCCCYYSSPFYFQAVPRSMISPSTWTITPEDLRSCWTWAVCICRIIARWVFVLYLVAYDLEDNLFLNWA
jgi:hypothetical protein